MLHEEMVPIKGTPLSEYRFGMRRINARYISRTGTPGHYVYVYASDRYSMMPRRFRTSFARMVNKARFALAAVKLKYGGEHTTKRQLIKPMNAHRLMVTFQRRNGSSLDLTFDLRSHGIGKYRSKSTGRKGNALSTAHQKGALRTR